MAERSVEQPPQGIAGQADRHEDQQHLPKGLVRDRLQRPALIGRLATHAKRQLDGQDSDHAVDRAARDEARPHEHLEALALPYPLACCFGTLERHRFGPRLNAHRDLLRLRQNRSIHLTTASAFGEVHKAAPAFSCAIAAACLVLTAPCRLGVKPPRSYSLNRRRYTALRPDIMATIATISATTRTSQRKLLTATPPAI